LSRKITDFERARAEAFASLPTEREVIDLAGSAPASVARAMAWLRQRRSRRAGEVAVTPDRRQGARQIAARPGRRGVDRARAMIEDAVDRMKTEAGDIILIAVGGGAFLVPDRLAAISEVIRVPHGDCANAVGAATAQISGETDQVYRDLSRADAIAAAEAQPSPAPPKPAPTPPGR
jgi:hypothetical protein